MKIEVGNYVRVSSDEEVLLAVALFIAAGFEFEEDEIYLGGSWGVHKLAEFHACVVACRQGKASCELVTSVEEEFENPVEIFFPSPETILLRL